MGIVGVSEVAFLLPRATDSKRSGRGGWMSRMVFGRSERLSSPSSQLQPESGVADRPHQPSSVRPQSRRRCKKGRKAGIVEPTICLVSCTGTLILRDGEPADFRGNLHDPRADVDPGHPNRFAADDQGMSIMNHTRLSSRIRLLALAGSLLGTAGLLNACNDAQAGALLGAGFGALAGQAIGGDTKGTVIGTAVGAGVGYVIGNESDKAKQQQRDRYDDYDY